LFRILSWTEEHATLPRKAADNEYPVFARPAEGIKMKIDNPYKPPKSLTELDNVQDCRREGNYILVPKGRDLPPRCIICNAEAVIPVKQKTLYWHSPWLYLLILLNILIYAFVALLARRKTRVSPGYCQMHLSARKKKIYAFLGVSMLFVLCGILLMFTEYAPFGYLFFMAAFLLLIPAIVIANRFRAVRIDKNGAKFAGCKEPFLNSFGSVQ
jgi:hypothetical protein